MQGKFALSQAESDAFFTLVTKGGQRAAFLALLAYKGVTTSGLAEALGVSPSMVSKMCGGQYVSRPVVVNLREMGVPEQLLPCPSVDVVTSGQAAA